MNANPELIKAIANNLSTLSVLLNNLAGNKTEENKKPNVTEQPKPAITLAEVRGKLAALSQARFTKEIRGILADFGAKKLSEVKPDDYEAVLAEAQKLHD